MIKDILFNITYDVAKHIVSTFLPNRSKKVDFNIETHVGDSIANYLENTPSGKYKVLDESSLLVEYFKNPQIKEMFFVYYKYVLTGTIETRTSIEDQHITRKDEFVQYLYTDIIQFYKERDSSYMPEDWLLKEFINDIFNQIENVIVSYIKPEQVPTHLMLHRRFNQMQMDISKWQQELEHMIRGMMERPTIPKVSDYEERREKYLSILKSKNEEQFIYPFGPVDFNAFYVVPNLVRGNDLTPRARYCSRIEWNNVFNYSNIIYLVGGAGFGKSLFTKKIVISFTQLNIIDADKYLLINGELKDFFDGHNIRSAISFLSYSINKQTLVNNSDTEEFVDYYLKQGRCILLLDALDEVPKYKRNELYSSIDAFFKAQHPGNKICITSRNRGFVREDAMEVIWIQPLNMEQIQKYVKKMISLGKFPAEYEESFLKQTEKLIENGFLTSFLVLSLLLTIYRNEKYLPENKVALYERCFSYINKDREKQKGSSHDWDKINQIMKDDTFAELAKLCAPNNKNIHINEIKECLVKKYTTKYGTEALAEVAVDHLLNYCEDRTELFVPTTDEHFHFFHRSFFEYFYAKYLFLKVKDPQQIYNEFSHFDVDSELFELTTAIIKENDEEKYQELIKIVFDNAEAGLNEQPINFTPFEMLSLAMQVVDDITHKKRYVKLLVDYHTLFCNKKVTLKSENIIAQNLHNFKELEQCEDYWRTFNKDAKVESTYLFLHWITQKNYRETGTENGNRNAREEYEIMDRMLSSRIRFYSKVYMERNSFLDDYLNIDKVYISQVLRKFNYPPSLRNPLIQMHNKFQKLKPEEQRQYYQSILEVLETFLSS